MSRSSTSIELVDYTPAVTQPPSVKLKGDDTPPLAEDLRSLNPPASAISAEPHDAPGRTTTAIVLATVVGVTMISSLLAGLVTIVLPTMAHELELDASLLLWYV